jgi:response regulator of citrate/malate metabolism
VGKAYETVLADVEELSQKNRHTLRSCRSAYRLLQGAVIAGHVSPEEAKNVLPHIVRYETERPVYVNSLEPYFDGIASRRSAIDRTLGNRKPRRVEFGERNLLVVDDQITTNGWEQVLAVILRNQLICADTTRQCKEQLQKHRQRISCILLDLRLPKSEEEGLALLSELKSIDEALPVVIFSATDSVLYAKQSFEKGAWDYFPKEPDAQFYRSSLEYYCSFCEIMNRIIRYDSEYYQKFWTRIQELEVQNKSKAMEQYAGLRERQLFHLKKAFRFLVQDEVETFSLSFSRASHIEEAVLQTALAVEVYCTNLILEKRITQQRVRSQRAQTGELTMTIEETIEPGVTLGEKISLLQKQVGKVSLSEEWFRKAFALNKLRGAIVHSVQFQTRKGRTKAKPSKSLTLNDAKNALQDALDIVTGRT